MKDNKEIKNSGSNGSVNRAEELNRQLFEYENRAEQLDAKLFGRANGGAVENKLSDGYVKKGIGFDDTEACRPSPTDGIWRTVAAVVLVMLVGFFGAVVGIYVLSASGFSDSNSMLGNMMIEGSGLELNKVVANESELVYTGGYIEVSEKLVPSIVMLTKLQLNEYGDGYVDKGSASGVIISEDGYIVTNEHVTVNMDAVRVTLENGNEYVAKIIGQDEVTDIALIKIDLPEGVKLKPVTLGVSENVTWGQRVIVVGNPMNVGVSVSTGIVSSPDREMESDGMINNVIQFDAAVSRGSSGGGMFDVYGNLLGVVCAKTIGDGIEGLGYAVPIDTVKKVVDDLLKYGYVKGRAILGITVASVFDPSSYSYYGNGELNGYLFESKYGVYILSSINSEEIKKGDCLIFVGGNFISSSVVIRETLKGYKPGDSITVTVERLTEDPEDGNATERIDINVVLAERDW